MHKFIKYLRRRQWDWTLQDTVLAKQHKLSRERIRQLRKQFGFDKSPNHYKHTKRKRRNIMNIEQQLANGYINFIKEEPNEHDTDGLLAYLELMGYGDQYEDVYLHLVQGLHIPPSPEI